MRRLSVIVPATDAPPTLARALAAIEGADRPPEELIVVDRPRGIGPAAARNLGAGRACGDVLVFVDADVEVHRDAFVRIRDAFDRDPSLVAIFGSYDDDPSPGRGGVVSDFRNLLHHHIHQENAGPATTFWAGLGAIRRGAFLEAGGFDSTRFPDASVEDIELGSRLSARGARLLLDPAIQGSHLKRWTFRGMVATDLLRRGVPWLRLLLESRARTDALNLGWRHRLSAVASVVLVVALVRRRIWAAACTIALLTALDGSFFRLLVRRRGPAFAVVALPLHVIHRLVSVAAVPIALGAHLRAAVRQRRV